MKIIYDTEKAIHTKQQIDTASVFSSSRSKIYSWIVIVICALFDLCMVVGMLNQVVKYSEANTALTAATIISGILIAISSCVWILWIVIAGLLCSIVLAIIENSSQICYPTAVRYYLVTKDQTVLRCYAGDLAKKRGKKSKFDFTVELKDSNNVVTTKNFIMAPITIETRTDIAELTVDLETDHIYIPYTNYYIPAKED